MSKCFVQEPARDLPVRGSYDVVVVGGGIAGAAAAVAAVRQGVSVCLIERSFCIGGLATAGNVIVFLPLCDGLGRQVTGGLAEEMLRLSIAHERQESPGMRVDAQIPACWQGPASREERKEKRYRVCFNPTRYMMVLERWLLENDVTLMYDTRFCAAVQTEDDAIEAVIVENKDGRSAICCQGVVDASGDADVCQAVGEPVASLRTNVRCGWFYYQEDGDVKIECLSKPYDRNTEPHPQAGRHYAGDIADDVTAQVVDSRQLIWEILERRQQRREENVAPILIPSTACFRMTRRLQARNTLLIDDRGKWCDDAVAMVGDWREPGKAFCIGLDTLLATKTKNLITAGRCISAHGSAWDMARAIPVCAASGEAAGTAAALAISARKADFASLQVPPLQERLRQNGVILDRTLLED